MSEYVEPVKAMIKSKRPISGGPGEFYIYDDKRESCLCISFSRVTYKGYLVPMNESDAEDLYNMIAMSYALQEEKNKKSALDELKGEK